MKEKRISNRPLQNYHFNTRNHPDYRAAWRQKDLDFVTSHAFRKMIREHAL